MVALGWCGNRDFSVAHLSLIDDLRIENNDFSQIYVSLQEGAGNSLPAGKSSFWMAIHHRKKKGHHGSSTKAPPDSEVLVYN